MCTETQGNSRGALKVGSPDGIQADLDLKGFASAWKVIVAEGCLVTCKGLGGDTEEQNKALALKHLASCEARGVATKGYSAGSRKIQ